MVKYFQVNDNDQILGFTDERCEENQVVINVQDGFRFKNDSTYHYNRNEHTMEEKKREQTNKPE